MTLATVYLLDENRMMDFYLGDQDTAGRAAWAAGQYRLSKVIEIDCTGEAGAEELFDLSNNPGRDDERARVYGRNVRSVSVGDIVQVDGVRWLCRSTGWSTL